MEDRFERHRLCFYVGILIFLFGVAILWVRYSTDIEFGLFFGKVMESFLYLFIGFTFYYFKIPEAWTDNRHI